MASDSFLDDFIQNDSEIKKRCLSFIDFDQELDNEKHDVPLQDMYNRGLALTQRGNERQNLQLEGGQRCGLTGYIPSAEEGLMMGANPQPKDLVMELGRTPESEIELSKRRRGLLR